MSSLLRVTFAMVAYVLFLIVFLYAIGFTGNVLVPKGIDDGEAAAPATALLVNLALMTLFACQHSIMARPAFKRWWTRIVPRPNERSLYVLLASLTLALLFWQWRPMPAAVWQVTDPLGAGILTALFWMGWLVVLLSTFMISHFELFGISQVLADLAKRTMSAPVLSTPMLYRYVRHPIYLGFLIAFWSTPTMSVGHLLFSIVTTAYILVGIQLEERDLVGYFGEAYLSYRNRVGMLFPRIWRGQPGTIGEVRKA